jgi:hypothetical protein
MLNGGGVGKQGGTGRGEWRFCRNKANWGLFFRVIFEAHGEHAVCQGSPFLERGWLGMGRMGLRVVDNSEQHESFSVGNLHV